MKGNQAAMWLLALAIGIGSLYYLHSWYLAIGSIVTAALITLVNGVVGEESEEEE